MENHDLKTSLQKAFEKAIDEFGIDNFKKCSWFGSNDPAFKNKGCVQGYR